jgi:transposase
MGACHGSLPWGAANSLSLSGRRSSRCCRTSRVECLALMTAGCSRASSGFCDLGRRSGSSWADLPERYGPPTTVCNRFNRWRKGRRLGQADGRDHCHPRRQGTNDRFQHCARSPARSRPKNRLETPVSVEVGGGLTTKLHLRVVGNALPVQIELSPGQMNDQPTTSPWPNFCSTIGRQSRCLSLTRAMTPTGSGISSRTGIARRISQQNRAACDEVIDRYVTHSLNFSVACAVKQEAPAKEKVSVRHMRLVNGLLEHCLERGRDVGRRSRGVIEARRCAIRE